MAGVQPFHNAPFHLGDLYIDPTRNLVLFPDGPATLQPKLMEVLTFLCSHQGQVVSADKLVDTCWPNQYVSDSPVHKCIAQLRKILQDTSKSPTYIRTVPKKGYMVIEKVSGLDRPSSHGEPFWSDAAPYPGDRAYTADEKAIFFGRERVTADLAEWAGEVSFAHTEAANDGGGTAPYPWLSLYGPAGCGKTSLVRASLMPHLTSPQDGKPAIFHAPSLYLDLMPASDTPAAHQLLNLLLNQKLIPSIGTMWDSLLEAPTLPGAARSWAELIAFLEEGFRKLNGTRRAVLFIDHLETALVQGNDADTAAFSALLDALAATGRCLLITAVQERFLPSLDTLLPHHTEAYAYQLPEFSKSEIVDIVQRPVAATGLNFDYSPTSRERLDTQIIYQQYLRPAPVFVLQRLMTRLYAERHGKTLTFAAYEEAGGLGGCLAELSEQAFACLSPGAQSAFEDTMLRLVDLDAAGSVAAPAAPLKLSEFGESVRQSLLNPLMDKGILQATLRDDDIYVQLAHESQLTHWPRLARWIESNVGTLYLRRDVKTATERWLRQGRHKDFLLESGRLINRGSALMTAGPFTFTTEEKLFLEKSAKKHTLRRRVKAAVIGGLTGAVIALAGLSVTLRLQGEQLQANRANAENLISSILFDLKDKLEPLGKLELLQTLGARAKDYFDSAGTENLTAQSLVQWVQALNLIGEVHAKKLEYDEAEAYFGRSLAALAAAEQKHGALPELLEQQMLTNYWLGYVLFSRKNYASAEPFFENYHNVAGTLAKQQPDNAKWQLEASYALTNLGSLAERTGRLGQAADYFGRSAAIKDALLQADPENNALRDGFANTLSWQASALKPLGRLNDAANLYLRALELVSVLRETDASNFKWVYGEAVLEHRLALVLYDMGELQRSYRHSESAQSLLIRLVANDPENQNNRKNLFWSQMLAARTLREQGQYDESLAALGQAAANNETLGAAGYTNRDISLVRDQARLFAAMGQKQAAVAALGRARALAASHDAVVLTNPDDYGELLLLEYDIRTKFGLPHDEAFITTLRQTYSDLRSLTPQPKLVAVRQAIADRLGLPAQDRQPALADLYPEYRNPDLTLATTIRNDK